MLKINSLGSTKLPVTCLGYGSMGLRGPATWGVRTVAEEDADKFLNQVLDAGINFIDSISAHAAASSFSPQSAVATINNIPTTSKSFTLGLQTYSNVTSRQASQGYKQTASIYYNSTVATLSRFNKQASLIRSSSFATKVSFGF